HQLSAKLRDELEDVSALVLVQFAGLTVSAAEELRAKFREAGCSYHVYKNSTIRFATEGTRHEPIRELLKGVSGLAFNAEDPAAPARVARDFAKTHDELTVKGGVSDGALLDPAGVGVLASMPGPLELKAQLLALLNTPATQMVRVLNAPAQSFVYLLNAKKDKDAA
ncbi:MAG: 50S ribosomal protein L10, partial [Nannocystaceae bacterium]